MGPTTIGFGLFLILVGLFGFWTSETHSPTALIPAGFGLVLAILGALACKDSWRKHAMHTAAAVGLIGFLGTAGMSAPKLLTLLGGGEVERPRALAAQGIMALACAVFVGLCVKSFLDARRARAQREG